MNQILLTGLKTQVEEILVLMREGDFTTNF